MMDDLLLMSMMKKLIHTLEILKAAQVFKNFADARTFCDDLITDTSDFIRFMLLHVQKSGLKALIHFFVHKILLELNKQLSNDLRNSGLR